MKQKVLDKYPNAKMVKVKFGGMLENRIIIVNKEFANGWGANAAWSNAYDKLCGLPSR